MAFKILFTFVIILYVTTLTFNTSYEGKKVFSPPLMTLKKLSSTKEFFKLCQRRRKRHHQKRSGNNTTAVVFLRLLLLSGDIESNPGPWTCSRCSLIFRQQQKFDNHLANQETVSCRYCNREFCSTRGCKGHERTCPNRFTTTQRADSDTGPWKCARCNQCFEHKQRYQTHLTNQEFISCQYCQRHFCRRDRCKQHERSEHSSQNLEIPQEAVGGSINLDTPIIGDTKYQRMKGMIRYKVHLTDSFFNKETHPLPR